MATPQQAKTEYVRVGSVSLPLYPHPKGYRVAWRTPSGEWKYITRKKRADVIEAAKAKADEITAGTVAFSKLTPEQANLLQRVLALGITHADLDAWQKSKLFVSPKVSDVIADMVQEKTVARGEKGMHLSILEGDLKTLPQDVPINSLSVQDMVEWLEGHRKRKVSQRRLANLRGSAVNLFCWAQEKGWLPEGKTAPQRTAKISSNRGKGREQKIEVYSVAELRALLTKAPETWHAFIVMGAFAGVRTEEMAPRATTKSEGLDWKDVDRAQGIIRMPAHVSKTGHPRIIPIQPNLEAWLKHLQVPKSGPIMATSLSAGRYELHKSGDVDWKKNGLRHSYGTYRTAQTQDMPKVSLEMGNSVGVIQRHYYKAVPQNEGDAWFACFP